MKKIILLLILGMFLFSFSSYAAEMPGGTSVADIAVAGSPTTEAGCGPVAVKPLSVTTTDADGFPWPWFVSGGTCSGIAYFETKGEGYVRIKVAIVDNWGSVTDSFNLGDYYFDPTSNSGSCTVPSVWYANLSTTCGDPGVFKVVINFKRLLDGKTWTTETKLRIW